MSLSVERAMSRSAQAFRELVWPRFADRLGGGRLIPVESVTDSEFASLLDQQAGIDAWQVVEAGGIRGLASRVQWGLTTWESWTVRKRTAFGGRTEYDKLIDPDISLLRPGYHIQAYIFQGQLLRAGCIQTTDLIRLLLAGEHGKEQPNPADGALFVPVWWDRAEELGYRVWRT